MEFFNLSIFVFFALILLTKVSGQTFEENVNELVDLFKESHKLPAAIGLTIYHNSAENGIVELTKAYGLKSIDPNVDADINTLFCIASISKLFTGILAVKILSDKFPQYGERVLDVPIKDLVPEFAPMFSDKYRTENVNFRDLLSHRTCLEKTDMLPVSSGAVNTPEEIIYRLRYAQEICPFRSEPVYHNIQVTLAAEILAKIVKIPLPDLLDFFLKDLEMTSSFAIRNTTDLSTIEHMSSGIVRNGEDLITYNPKLLERIHVGKASGGLVTSPRDMMKFIHFFMNRGRVGGNVVIPEELFHWLARPTILAAEIMPSFLDNGLSFDDLGIGFGVSFMIGQYKGTPRMVHTGYWPPMVSRIDFYPRENIGIFSVANGPGELHGPYSHDQFHNDIYELLNGNTGVLASRKKALDGKEMKKFPMPEKMMKKSPSKLVQIKNEQYVGHYGHPVQGEFDVVSSPSDAGLELKYGPWAQGLLWLQPDNTYWIEYTTDIIQEFYAAGLPAAPNMFLEFSENSAILINFDGSKIEYIKDQNLDQLPEQPWEDECPATPEPEPCPTTSEPGPNPTTLSTSTTTNPTTLSTSTTTKPETTSEPGSNPTTLSTSTTTKPETTTSLAHQNKISQFIPFSVFLALIHKFW